MSEEIRLVSPPTKEEISRLKPGDKVLLSGTLYTARDKAHRRMIENLPDLPFPIQGQIIYYTGPTPKRQGLPIGSCGPTTSSRLDIYTPKLLSLGLLGTIGKGPRSLPVIESIKKYSSIYFTTIGGAGALLAKRVKSAELVAYEDLGCEAIFRLEVEDFPVWVEIDCRGNSMVLKKGTEDERTLVIIKPDGVVSRLIGEVIKRFEERDFKVIALKMVNLTKEGWGKFYEVHKDKPFYHDFIEFMSSSPSIVMVLEGEDVIMEARRLIGDTDPKLACLGTIRSDYATDIRHNIVHGSDSKATAEGEISFFFKEDEIWSY